MDSSKKSVQCIIIHFSLKSFFYFSFFYIFLFEAATFTFFCGKILLMDKKYLKKMIYAALFIILSTTAILVIFLLLTSKESDDAPGTEAGTEQQNENTETDRQAYAEKYRETVESQHYIIHALGGMNGTDNYINSIDPLRLIYAEGYRLFEADVSFTSDGKLVLAHSGQDNVWSKNDWTERLGQDYPFDDASGGDNSAGNVNNGDASASDASAGNASSDKSAAYDSEKHLCDYDTFMSFKIQKKYKATSFKELIEFMAEHDDMFVMIDGGERSYEDTKTFYSAILEETREVVSKMSIELSVPEEDLLNDVLGRMVVGGQTIEMLDAVKEVYDFPLINFYYNSNEKREGELCKPIDFIHYCDANGVSSFSVAKEVYDQQTAEALEKSTLMSFVFTVNDPAEEARINAYGADIIGTDFLWDE